MATMSLAPNPASVEQTGDKLSILETRLNSLQQNISVIQQSKPTTNDTGVIQQQQDEASSLKANSLLARIKATQERTVTVEPVTRSTPTLVANNTELTPSSDKDANLGADGFVNGHIVPPVSAVSSGTATVNDFELFESKLDRKMSPGIVSEVDNFTTNSKSHDEGEVPLDNSLNSELIEEQRRILEQLEAEKQSKEVAMKILASEHRSWDNGAASPSQNQIESALKQENEDFKLAMNLQKLEDMKSAEDNSSSAQQNSWRGWMSEKMYGSPDKQRNQQNSTQNTSRNNNMEGGNRNAGSATVAPTSGYFSCVVDSVSNLTSNGYNIASQPNNSTSTERTTVDYSPLLEEDV